MQATTLKWHRIFLSSCHAVLSATGSPLSWTVEQEETQESTGIGSDLHPLVQEVGSR